MCHLHWCYTFCTSVTFFTLVLHLNCTALRQSESSSFFTYIIRQLTNFKQPKLIIKNSKLSFGKLEVIAGNRIQGCLPFKRSIRVEILGINIQCCSLSKCKIEKSKRKMYQYQYESSKRKEKLHRLSRQPIMSKTFQMEWYLHVPFHFPTRISTFSM